ncbi:MAG: MFS transporter [Eubacteriaceae bacterium]|nr:MFS transporter [Eubacteriaceae bacterium]
MKESSKFKIIYAFNFAAMGALVPLLGQYLSSIGFTGTQIGVITSLGTTMAVFGSTFWGKVFSNARDERKVILLLCLTTAIMGISSSMAGTFLVFAVMYGIMYFFQGPIMGLNDAIVLSTGTEYASIRLWGAIGYSISVFVGGRIGQYLGLGNIFYIYACAFAIGGLLILTIKPNKDITAVKTGSETSPAVESKGEKVGYGQLLKEKKAVRLIICGAFIIGSTMGHNTYFSFLYRDGGGSLSGVGTIFLLMAGSEALFMPLAPWLSRKFTQEKVLLFAMILATLRFGWYATGPSCTALTATFFIQGIVNGLILVEQVKYLSRLVNPRLIGIAMAAYYAICSNGGVIVANFLGGAALEHFGSCGTYALFSLFNLTAVILYIAFGLHKSEKQ